MRTRDFNPRAETRLITGVGPVLFERSRRARRINISVRPFRGVRVAVPRGVSFARAEEAIRDKTGWMRRHLERMRAEEAAHEALKRENGPLDEKAARRKLTGRLEELSARFALTYSRVFIRRQKTLWGSCSAKGNISLNVQLAALPAHLMDYVITHELVHTRFLNHGKGFWAELERLYPGAREADRELRKYRLGLG